MSLFFKRLMHFNFFLQIFNALLLLLEAIFELFVFCTEYVNDLCLLITTASCYITCCIPSSCGHGLSTFFDERTRSRYPATQIVAFALISLLLLDRRAFNRGRHWCTARRSLGFLFFYCIHFVLICKVRVLVCPHVCLAFHGCCRSNGRYRLLNSLLHIVTTICLE